MDPGDRRAIVADADEFFRLGLSGLLREKFTFGTVGTLDRLSIFSKLDGTDWGAAALVCLELPESEASAIPTLRSQYRAARFVVLTHPCSRDRVLRFIEAGAHGVVVKGGGIAPLERALEIVLAGLVWVPPFVADIGLGPETIRPRADAPAGHGVRDALTPRQTEVLRLVSQGKSNKEIAQILRLREGTVKVHIAGLFRVLNVTNRSSAAVIGDKMNV